VSFNAPGVDETQFLRTYAVRGARSRLTEIDEERAEILRRFPELSTESQPDVTGTLHDPALLVPRRVSKVSRRPTVIVFDDAEPKKGRPLAKQSLRTVEIVEDRASNGLTTEAEHLTGPLRISRKQAISRLGSACKHGRITRVENGVYTAKEKP